MDTNLQHEDILIKLRAKLNEDNIKLWEPPYITTDNSINNILKELSAKYAKCLSIDEEIILQSLHELQIHSIDRSKANAVFVETGVATFRIKAACPEDKAKVIKVQKKLDEKGSDLINVVSIELGIEESRIKLIYNGKVLNAVTTLKEQGLKNGAQIMAIIMAVNPEQARKEDDMYLEMKSTRDDAVLLSECVDDLLEDDDYMKLEDQSGASVQLPPLEKKSLLVAMALHERGRKALKLEDYSLALLLFVTADTHFRECRSSILESVDNWAVLQLDIAWCYLCLQNLSSAADAQQRLQKAEKSFIKSYGENYERLITLKGSDANERVLIMRLYLLQGIVAFHQNRREDAKKLLAKAETELNSLKVQEESVCALHALGWSRAQAVRGLRAGRGNVDAAHELLTQRADDQRQRRQLGVCPDGSVVSSQLVTELVAMGFRRRLAIKALRNSNNRVSDAVALIQEHPEMIADSDDSSDTSSSEEADMNLVAELEAMGYETEVAKTALKMARNKINKAVDLLVASGGKIDYADDEGNPSTSAGECSRKKLKTERRNKRKEREAALRRLKESIRHEEDDYLDTNLVEEEQFLTQYKSLL